MAVVEERIAGICAHCAELFSRVIAASLPSEAWARRFCCIACAEAATVREPRRGAGVCPTPNKPHYPGAGAAMEAATNAAHRHHKAFRWYRCGCGRWCLTTWCVAGGANTVGRARDNGEATTRPKPRIPAIPPALRFVS